MNAKAWEYEKSSILKNLGSLRKAADDNQSISAVTTRRDPASVLTKELLVRVASLASTRDQVKCLRISRDWKIGLESEPSLWQDPELTLAGEDRYSGGVKKGGIAPLELFALNSGNTLTSVGIEFQDLEKVKVNKVFKILAKSSKSLQALTFSGYQVEANATSSALTLAAKCINLEYLDVGLEENQTDPYYSDPGGEFYDVVLMDRLDFKSYPSVINLGCSDQTEIRLGKCELFKNAKHIHLDFSKGHQGNFNADFPITQSNLSKILQISSKTLESLSVFQTPSLVNSGYYRGAPQVLSPIALPKLQSFEVKTQDSQNNYFSQMFPNMMPKKSKAVALVAPLLTEENFSVDDGSFELSSEIQVDD